MINRIATRLSKPYFQIALTNPPCLIITSPLDRRGQQRVSKTDHRARCRRNLLQQDGTRDGLTPTLLCTPSKAKTKPIFNQTVCATPVNSGWDDNPGDSIYVCIESDMGDEIFSCLPPPSNIDGISNEQVGKVVQAGKQ